MGKDRDKEVPEIAEDIWKIMSKEIHMMNIKRYTDHLRESQDSQAAPNPWLVYYWDLKAPSKDMDPKFRTMKYRPYFFSAHRTKEEAEEGWLNAVESTFKQVFIEYMEERTPPGFESPDDMKAKSPEEYEALRKTVLSHIARGRASMLFLFGSLSDILKETAPGFEDYGGGLADDNVEFFLDHIRTSENAPAWLDAAIKRLMRSKRIFGRM
jgi:hypothetical protein